MYSCSRNAQVAFEENPQLKNKHLNLIHTRSRKALKGVVEPLESAFPSLHEGLLEISLNCIINI